MEFGIFSNGFRPHTSAAQTYQEDLAEIVLADQLGFRDAYISEHHGEPVYIGKVDTLPVPELLMCKAAALTTQIRMGAAVKLIHLAHPVDTAIQAAVTDHVMGGGRFIFGFGSGFPNPLFANERGLSHEDRHPRLREVARSHSQVLDLGGAVRLGRQVLARQEHRRHAAPVDQATYADGDRHRYRSDDRSRRQPRLHAARRAARAGRTDQKESRPLCARRAGRGPQQAAAQHHRGALRLPRRFRREAMDDLRPAITYELGFQIKRGLIRILKSSYGLQVSGDDVSFDQLAEAGTYFLGEPDAVARELRQFYEAAGGFGTLLLVAGKDWATREKRARSLKLFMEQVAPQLRGLEPVREPDIVAA